ncbi:putative amidohydrolase YtcJ [Catenulispora sp. GP43]|uniref:amidohydrolase n=1 Tax=Catenulispora sp. GP43 TaxID=3156263 RepID=UPI003513F937
MHNAGNAAGPGSQAAGTTAKAETVFVGGRAFVQGASRPAAVAVAAGRIAAVAAEADVRALIGPATEVVDLAGGLLVPGFVDAHNHAAFAGLQLMRCDLSGQDEVEQYLKTIADYAADHPDAPWILGGGWSMDSFPGGIPTRHQLDAIVPDRPVYLTVRDGHGAWANTRALESAGLTRHTPDPADGRIEREPDGTPIGMLQEGAMDLVPVPVATHADAVAGLLAAQRHLFALGITGWQDAMIGDHPGNPDNYDVYRDAARSGGLKARVVGALWWDRERGLEQIPDILARRAESTVGRFTATTVKLMLDGIAENFTAAMLEPYLDRCGCATANRGLSFIDPDVLREAVRRLDAAGFQCHFHALGDRAVRQALDVLEAARAANGPNDNRHHLAHVQVVHPDDVPRFAALGAAANIQALWAAHERQMDELTIPFLGTERSAQQYPFGDLARAGARLVAGSDWNVSSPDPLLGMHVAVNRSRIGEESEPFYPEQALTLTQALTAYTEGSAWINHLDGETGTIAAGKLADLAVLDRDPFGQPGDRIGATRVRRTYVGGELVFAADA